MSEIDGLRPSYVVLDEASDPVTGTVVIKDGHIQSISIVEDSEGATGFVQVDTQKLITSHDDLQYTPHEYVRQIYTTEECRCGKNEFDSIHGAGRVKPDPNVKHPFDRRALSAVCKCDKPLWDSVHDVYEFEKETIDGS